ncbi:C6 transcription factor [Neofusicoccum parvum]|uniref:C6 transcription factor n=1 Tax=Neofusicoccum parvum TaxID=310453 RepID=A0ACB5SCB4_9PEZI|nr:C6 transcription factor [Neofusicoccum parvum]
MTVILRFDTSVVLDPIKREECLDHARRAFVALQNLKSHISKTMDEKSFASFLPWTVLYYPLRPYFVLFCNVVATSHVGDFELMKEFADTLMELPSLNSSAQRLQKLCATLVGLCAPLIQRAKEQHSNRTSNADGSKNAAPTNGMTSNIQNQQIFNNGVVGDGGIPMVGPGPSTSIGPWFQQNMIGGAGAISGISQDANGARTSSSEEMFNVLFDVQPSLDWLGSDVFGQGINWSDFDGSYSMN